MDMTGMAQKGGAVLSHLRIGESPETIFAPRLGAGMADLILGCDLVVTTGKETLQAVTTNETRAVVNSHVVPTAQFQANAKIDFSSKRMQASIDDIVGAERTRYVDATSLATRILGDSIATNLFMVGYVSQTGWLPLSPATIEEAIRLNGISVESNLRTFRWGRVAAAEPATAAAVAGKAAGAGTEQFSETLDEVIAKRVARLTDYQNAAWAARYSDVVNGVRAAEQSLSAGENLTQAVARNLAKLMSYKDEYEVARLHASHAQAARIAAQFDGDFKMKFNLAPPLISRKDPSTGRPEKIEFGGWMLPAFKMLQKGKRLRNTVFDIFGYSAERKAERSLIAEYVENIKMIQTKLTLENLPIAIQIAELPDEIRGYGYVKEESMAKAAVKLRDLLGKFAAPQIPAPVLIAAE
jgi:indolepyruvate ferredoxin oxidoreductase